MMQQLLLDLAPPPAPTLDNFVPGRNGAALEALRAIARGGRAERFVYLWGEAGSGRSHLLRALARAGSASPAVYLCAAVHGGIAGNKLIAIDDVQDLPPADQIELFDLYNRVRAAAGRAADAAATAAAASGGALVAGGNAAPARLALRDDLRSRLAWGLAFQLHPLSEAEKTAALRAHARARALELPEELITYLLKHAPRDMASLIGILDALDRYSLEQKRQVTLPLVRDALESMKHKPA